jgi:predicted DNA-binding protein
MPKLTNNKTPKIVTMPCTVFTRYSREEYERLLAIAVREERTPTSLVRMAVREYIEERQNTPWVKTNE